MYVFSPVESKSDVYFRRSGPENLDNTEKNIFWNIEDFWFRATEMDTEFLFYRTKNPNSYLFNPVNSHYPKYQDR